jgi:phosphoserine phosphatase
LVFIATLIASDRLTASAVEQAREGVAASGGEPGAMRWIDEGVAADVPFAGLDRPTARAALERLLPGVDVVIQPEAGRRKRLLIADMDSTMITIKAEVAEVTERAMRGELDFEGALTARVGLLKGLDAGVIDRCHAERVRIMPGAKALVRTMRANGARTVLVSGGFTVFADRVAGEIGFDRALSNRLGIAGAALDGTVALPIVGAAAKLDTLNEEIKSLGLEREQTLAVGDGANDIPMIEAAGLGVAYHAKPKTAAAAAARIDHGDLTALLYAQGYPRKDWAD